MLLQLILN